MMNGNRKRFYNNIARVIAREYQKPGRYDVEKRAIRETAEAISRHFAGIDPNFRGIQEGLFMSFALLGELAEGVMTPEEVNEEATATTTEEEELDTIAGDLETELHQDADEVEGVTSGTRG